MVPGADGDVFIEAGELYPGTAAGAAADVHPLWPLTVPHGVFCQAGLLVLVHLVNSYPGAAPAGNLCKIVFSRQGRPGYIKRRLIKAGVDPGLSVLFGGRLVKLFAHLIVSFVPGPVLSTFGLYGS